MKLKYVLIIISAFLFSTTASLSQCDEEDILRRSNRNYLIDGPNLQTEDFSIRNPYLYICPGDDKCVDALRFGVCNATDLFLKEFSFSVEIRDMDDKTLFNKVFRHVEPLRPEGAAYIKVDLGERVNSQYSFSEYSHRKLIKITDYVIDSAAQANFLKDYLHKYIEDLSVDNYIRYYDMMAALDSSIRDAKLFERYEKKTVSPLAMFWREFRIAVIEDDTSKVADLSAFPVYDLGHYDQMAYEVFDRTEFVQRYVDLFDEKIIEVCKKTEELSRKYNRSIDKENPNYRVYGVMYPIGGTDCLEYLFKEMDDGRYRFYKIHIIQCE